MLLAQISDTHLVAAGPRRTARALSLERAIDWLLCASPRPAAVIHTGDVAHNGKAEQYALARQLLSRLDLPLIVVPGNRDARELLMAAAPPPVARAAGSPFLQLVMDLGAIRLIALDTLVEGRGLGGFCDRRHAELQEFLAAGDGRPTVVALHHPPVALPAVPGSSHFADSAEAHRLAITLARDASVVAVLAGHVHRRATAPLGRATLETMPSLAVDLRKGVYLRGQASCPLVQLHEVTATRVITTMVVLEAV